MEPESGRQEPVFDYETAIARLDHDVELFRDMVQFFLEDSPELLRQIRAGVRAGELRAAERAAHSLKGLSATFDAHLVVRATSHIEELARAAALPELPTAVDTAEREVHRLHAALEKFRR